MNAHKLLQQYFIPAGLTITKQEWYSKDDGTFSFSGSISSTGGKLPTRINGASHGNFTATADSPEKVIIALFEMAKSEKLWIGTYADYHSVIEWNAANDRFVAREISEAEKFEQYSMY